MIYFIVFVNQIFIDPPVHVRHCSRYHEYRDGQVRQMDKLFALSHILIIGSPDKQINKEHNSYEDYLLH